MKKLSFDYSKALGYVREEELSLWELRKDRLPLWRNEASY